MPPFEQTLEQRQAAFNAAGVIDSQALEPVTAPKINQLDAPAIPSIKNLPPIDTPETDALDQLSTLEAQISNFDSQAQVAQRVRPEAQELLEINKRIGLLQAREEQAAARALESGETLRFARGEEAAVRREAAIEAMRLNAFAQAAVGNITLARQVATDAVNTEFQQLERQVGVARQNIIDNWDIFTDGQRKRAESTLLRLNADDNFIKEQKEEKKAINEVAFTLARNGFGQDVLDEVLAQDNIRDAVTVAGSRLQDPAARQQLKNAELDYKLKEAQLRKTNQEMALLQRYGGLTPSQWLKEQEKEEKEAIKSQEKADAAIERGRTLSSNIEQVTAILDSRALDTVVGSNVFSRGIGRQKGFFSKLASGFGGILTLGATSGVVDEVSGGADDVVALTEQLLSQEFLNKLIASKGEGATFGQLSDAEGAKLAAAANAVSQTAIKKDNKVIGYDMSEALFRKQMGIVQERLQFLYKKTTGNAFTSDEDELLDSFFGVDVADFGMSGATPSIYFSN